MFFLFFFFLYVMLKIIDIIRLLISLWDGFMGESKFNLLHEHNIIT